MKKFSWMILLLFVVLILFSSGCVKKTEIDIEKNKELLTGYVSDFLESIYAEQYELKDVITEVTEFTVDDGSFSAYMFTKMTYNNYTSDSVDEVGYIKEAREKAENETDTKLREMYQKQYETLRDEYLIDQESNFEFKAEGKLKEELVDLEKISLYLAQDGEQGKVFYVPAEDLAN